MRFEVLGPLRAFAGPDETAITAARERVLLAMLLLHLDRPVPVDHLVDAIWAERPPARARNEVQKCVSRLRARLGGHLLLTAPSGYRIPATEVAVDLSRFRDLAGQARQAAAVRDLERARTHYRAALALWRGWRSALGTCSPRTTRTASSS